MAKKTTPTTKKSPAVAKTAAPTTTAVRNSAIPKISPAKKEITHEMIAARAYDIYTSGKGGSEQENWSRAERELRGL